jgi:tetratricopeptide (TPR) repeat protein
MRKWTPILVLAACLVGCQGKSPADYQKAAQAALDARDPAKAIHLTEEALGQDAVRQDPAMAWRLEQVRLEALARHGKGAQVKTELERLAGVYPKQVGGSLYRSLADGAREAGDNTGAIEILTAGDERFPDEHAKFAEAIEALKNAEDLDPAQVEKLKSLGYL